MATPPDDPHGRIHSPSYGSGACHNDRMPTPERETALETDRLLLRPWRISEARVQRELWFERDPRVPPHRRISAEGRPTLRELEDRIRCSTQEPAPGLLAVERKQTGDVIGYCGLISNESGPEAEPELAFELLRSTHGQGYATEAARVVLDAAKAAGHHRLWASVRVWNEASRRVLAKLGFVETDRVEPDGVHGDSLVTTKIL